MCQFSNKFYAAVRTLSGDGPIKDRLTTAYDRHLGLISADDVPETIRPRFELLRRQMHAATPNGQESAVVASVRKMSAADASGCASLIIAMFSELVLVKSTGESLGMLRRQPKRRKNGNGREPARLN